MALAAGAPVKFSFLFERFPLGGKSVRHIGTHDHAIGPSELAPNEVAVVCEMHPPELDLAGRRVNLNAKSTVVFPPSENHQSNRTSSVGKSPPRLAANLKENGGA